MKPLFLFTIHHLLFTIHYSLFTKLSRPNQPQPHSSSSADASGFSYCSSSQIGGEALPSLRAARGERLRQLAGRTGGLTTYLTPAPPLHRSVRDDRCGH